MSVVQNDMTISNAFRNRILLNIYKLTEFLPPANSPFLNCWGNFFEMSRIVPPPFGAVLRELLMDDLLFTAGFSSAIGVQTSLVNCESSKEDNNLEAFVGFGYLHSLESPCLGFSSCLEAK